jgi:cytochrome d ubiquinol oxidase subunit II
MDLNTIWFVLFGVLLTGYAILDGFDLGVGVLSLLARTDHEKRLHMNAVGPVWDGNEVWLLTAGGALFAAFPGVYATVFSGFYLALVLVLIAMIARAVSFEFRSKVEHAGWRRVWDLAFGIGSLLLPVLFGVAVGNILRGVPLDARTEYAGTFFDLLNPYAILIGVLSLAMFVTHGAAYMAIKSEGDLRDRMLSWVKRGWLAWAALFALATAATAWLANDTFSSGLKRPVLWLFALLAFGGLGLVPYFAKTSAPGKAWVASATAIAGSIGVAASSMFPKLVPALGDSSRSLTIYTSSSTPRTLMTMLVIALIGMPLVIGYTAFIYRVFKGKVEISEESY